MAKSGAEIAHEHQAIVGTYAEAPSQGAFIGRLAMVLIGVLVICALLGIVLGIRG